MTSQIVFMEHNPLTMLKRPNSPSALSNFFYQICSTPHRSHQRSDYIYASDIVNELRGNFTIELFGSQMAFKGRYFRSQGSINEYLQERDIALRQTLVNLAVIRQRAGSTGSILLLEEMKYTAGIADIVVNRAKSILKVASSGNTSGSVSADNQFLSVQKGILIHARTKDPIPPDQWIPLYRPGSILSAIPEHEPINLETCEHVIF